MKDTGFNSTADLLKFVKEQATIANGAANNENTISQNEMVDRVRLERAKRGIFSKMKKFATASLVCATLAAGGGIYALHNTLGSVPNVSAETGYQQSKYQEHYADQAEQYFGKKDGKRFELSGAPDYKFLIDKNNRDNFVILSTDAGTDTVHVGFSPALRTNTDPASVKEAHLLATMAIIATVQGAGKVLDNDTPQTYARFTERMMKRLNLSVVADPFTGTGQVVTQGMKEELGKKFKIHELSQDQNSGNVSPDTMPKSKAVGEARLKALEHGVHQDHPEIFDNPSFN